MTSPSEHEPGLIGLRLSEEDILAWGRDPDDPAAWLFMDMVAEMLIQQAQEEAG